MRRVLIALLAPINRILPPWWKVRVYFRLAGRPFEQGGYSGMVKTSRIDPHGFLMQLALDDWMERCAYFVGCYYEIDATATLVRLLRPGDCFMDVGANLGFLTLTASKAVGPEGRVLAFEPNTELAARLDHTLRANGIGNVAIHANALGEDDGEAHLDVTHHFGAGNLRGIGGAAVEVLRGDHFTSGLAANVWVFVKLDVEGFELRVLKGLSSLLTRARTGFLVEVTDQWLQAVGGSAEELFGLMSRHGFHAYRPKVTLRSTFELLPMVGALPDVHQYDVVFLRPEDGWLTRR